ncbi:PTS IIA-like nitrogen regulatory protein PtsN [Jiella sonneratiae]|uniref:PTS IIA-like nitrogen regulatory protein PtsN n=1 Tax=Jiella sonneratiae TaxID=2816856 RepID=A0ABS3J627_9HYPH|nr:PTS IIA-like nitrogen regulatory protein PtsN [Jiella sonneratiae]MBO0905124.1 PTS IIA-like nitrogen regulatory protein PtsN [Jiella sonneratiae]
MEVNTLIDPGAILPDLKANSKKQVLQELAGRAAELTGLSEREIFETILGREKLGSTGVGNGIAIPHGKLADLDRIVGLFARLSRPVEFDALDDQPVDIVFLLLAPQGSGAEHLKALSKVARLLRNRNIVDEIRATRDGGAIYALMTNAMAQNAA